MEYISIENCKHGYLYKIHSRNLSYGVCSKYEKGITGFLGIRTKFGDKFLFEEFHYDNGPDEAGTVKPLKCLKKCPLKDISYNYPLFLWLEKTIIKYK